MQEHLTSVASCKNLECGEREGGCSLWSWMFLGDSGLIEAVTLGLAFGLSRISSWPWECGRSGPFLSPDQWKSQKRAALFPSHLQPQPELLQLVAEEKELWKERPPLKGAE